MFWRFGGYANISTIDTLLEKPEVSLEELLDESDLIQELKQHNSKLIEYLREQNTLEMLLDYVTAPKLEPVASEEPDDESEDEVSKGKGKLEDEDEDDEEEVEEETEKQRNRYAYVAAEILSSDNWSISETLMEDQALLRKFWDFIKLPPPLDPLQASYFTKVNEALLDKKTEEMLELFKSLDGVVKNMLQHVDSPMIMDLLLKIISLEKAEGGQGVVEWLHSQDIIPILLSFLSSEHSWAIQTSAGDFLKAIITISANASQNEASCIGPNELTRQLVSHACVEKLISDMLKGGNPLTVGVGIIIEVIRKNNSDYDPEVTGDGNATPSSRDPIYLGTLLRLFAQHVPDFMNLILGNNTSTTVGSARRKELNSASGRKVEPLGFDRFKTCELMAELLHCSNMGLLNELGSEEFINARDEEREILKREGKLNMHNDSTLATDDEFTMKSSTMIHGSPDSNRRLEVQNASDEDFEEVTHSGDLGDDAKAELIEKPEDEEPGTARPETFLDKDDDEFFDEPLSSPRLNCIEPQQPMDEPDMAVLPLSPTKELSQQVGSLGFQEDTPMTSSQPAETGAEASEDFTTDTTTPDETPKGSTDQTPASTAEESSGTTEPTSTTSAGIEPRPEDQPAPLFSKAGSREESVEQKQSSGDIVTDSADTIMGEATDVDQTQSQDVSIDQTPTPVVGDFLKMQFVEHKVVPSILDFFFRFSWNNFLHNVVYDVVQQVFNGPMDRGYNRFLAINLFETGDITMRIVDGQKKSDESEKKNKMRLGYMGHLTLIAEEVVKFTERHPPELLSEMVLEKVMNGEWISYVEVTLAETRERDNAILGGVRPDMSVGPRQAVMNAVNAAANNFGGGASSALAEAGLNGSAGLDSIELASATSNGSPGSNFSLTGGNILSGFGSSSDEEEDEMEEDNEDEGARNQSSGPEFSRYITHPSTTTSTTVASSNADLSPPSIPPPPPPPLNVPPSRARRQLAARLALHKQNADKEKGENDNKPKPKNINPFASPEEDEDDKDEDFAIGDVEVVEEGKKLPARSGEADSQGHHDNNVGNPQHHSAPSSPSATTASSSPSSSSSASSPPSLLVSPGPSGTGFVTGGLGTRSKFSSMVGWPLLLSSNFHSLKAGSAGGKNTSRSQADYNEQSEHSSDEEIRSDDDDDDDIAYGDRPLIGGQGQKVRRLSMTTEAKRRTSLEDDDEEDGVVHVGMTHAGDAGKGVLTGGQLQGGSGTGTEDDGELVEIQHAEMQGVENAVIDQDSTEQGVSEK